MEGSSAHPFVKTWWISPGKLLGGPKLGDNYEEWLQCLDSYGIATIICLQRAEEDISSWNEEVRTCWTTFTKTGNCKQWFRFPIGDGDVPSRDVMVEALNCVDRHLKDGGVYVHCYGGHGRTGTLAGCWLRRHGMEVDEVLKHIQSARCHDLALRAANSPETDDQLQFIVAWERGS